MKRKSHYGTRLHFLVTNDLHSIETQPPGILRLIVVLTNAHVLPKGGALTNGLFNTLFVEVKYVFASRVVVSWRSEAAAFSSINACYAGIQYACLLSMGRSFAPFWQRNKFVRPRLATVFGLRMRRALAGCLTSVISAYVPPNHLCEKKLRNGRRRVCPYICPHSRYQLHAPPPAAYARQETQEIEDGLQRNSQLRKKTTHSKIRARWWKYSKIKSYK